MTEKTKYTEEDYRYELYKASLAGFIRNESNNDKLILGLSVSGTGFLVSALKDLKDISETVFVASSIALLAFFITSMLTMLIFYYNRKQLTDIIEKQGMYPQEVHILKILDNLKYITFLTGVIVSTLLALVLLY